MADSDSLDADDAVRDAAAAIRCAVADDLEGLVAIARNADPVPTFVGLATFCSYLLDEHITLLRRVGRKGVTKDKLIDIAERVLEEHLRGMPLG